MKIAKMVFVFLVFVFLALVTIVIRVSCDPLTGTEKAITYLINRDPHPYQNKPAKIAEIARAIEKAAQMFDVDPLLLVAMAHFESHFSPQILSLKKLGKAGEKGLLQTGKDALRSCPYFVDTVEGQAMCGARWLRQGIDDCGGNEVGGLTMYASGNTCIAAKGDRLLWKVNRRLNLRNRLRNYISSL